MKLTNEILEDLRQCGLDLEEIERGAADPHLLETSATLGNPYVARVMSRKANKVPGPAPAALIDLVLTSGVLATKKELIQAMLKPEAVDREAHILIAAANIIVQSVTLQGILNSQVSMPPEYSEHAYFMSLECAALAACAAASAGPELRAFVLGRVCFFDSPFHVFGVEVMKAYMIGAHQGEIQPSDIICRLDAESQKIYKSVSAETMPRSAKVVWDIYDEVRRPWQPPSEYFRNEAFFPECVVQRASSPHTPEA